MATKITKWQTEDGKEWNTEEEAAEHETECNLFILLCARIHRLDYLDSHNRIDMSDLREAIKSDVEVRRLLREYLN